MISQTRSGGIDFMSTAGTNLQTLVPTAGRRSSAPTCAARWPRSTCMHSRSAWTTATATSRSSTKPINTPDDLKGFKIRVPGIALWVSMFKALGASPTVVPFGELYSALQTKVVDGQENPLALISQRQHRAAASGRSRNQARRPALGCRWK